jgi:hypothetical protein
MVALAARASGRRTKISPQTKITTVMLRSLHQGPNLRTLESAGALTCAKRQQEDEKKQRFHIPLQTSTECALRHRKPRYGNLMFRSQRRSG